MHCDLDAGQGTLSLTTSAGFDISGTTPSEDNVVKSEGTTNVAEVIFTRNKAVDAGLPNTDLVLQTHSACSNIDILLACTNIKLQSSQTLDWYTRV